MSFYYEPGLGLGRGTILGHKPYPIFLLLKTDLCIKTPCNFQDLLKLPPSCFSSFTHSFNNLLTDRLGLHWASQTQAVQAWPLPVTPRLSPPL